MTNMNVVEKNAVAFYDVLKKTTSTVSFVKFGHDIEAACGQLRSSQMKRDPRWKTKHNKIEQPTLQNRGVVLCKRKVLLFSAKSPIHWIKTMVHYEHSQILKGASIYEGCFQKFKKKCSSWLRCSPSFGGGACIQYRECCDFRYFSEHGYS